MAGHRDDIHARPATAQQADDEQGVTTEVARPPAEHQGQEQTGRDDGRLISQRSD
jgi:hypothetical protein